jgi:hypothetical protein
MLIMLVAGIPLYVCATASTPIAAALILKGISPGAALVFLLVGPATNMATLTVLIGTFGKRSTAVYLGAIAVCAILFGLAVNELYALFNVSAQAVIGQAAETMPHGLALLGSVVLVLLSIRPLWRILKKALSRHSVAKAPKPVQIQLKPDSARTIPSESCSGPT